MATFSLGERLFIEIVTDLSGKRVWQFADHADCGRAVRCKNTGLIVIANGSNDLAASAMASTSASPDMNSTRMAIVMLTVAFSGDLDRAPNAPKEDRFALESSFTLSSTAPGINPVTEPVTLQIATFSITVPPGFFKKHEGENEEGFFTFRGVVDGVKLEALIKRTATLRYAFDAEAKGANLTGTTNPVTVSLSIGDNSGTTSVKANIDY